MANLKSTTVTGTLGVTGAGTFTLPVTQSAAATTATHLLRKGEADAALLLKIDTTDVRLTDARTPAGTATGGEITGTYPNGLAVANRTINQALATPGNVGDLTSLLSWLAGAIKAGSGETNWFDAPDTTLVAAAAHIANTSNPHSVTATQVGLGSVTNDLQLTVAGNLFELAGTAATARGNLGLAGAAILNVGTGAGTVCAGNDSRLTNARTPTSHAASHKLGGTDVILLHEFGLPTSSVNLNFQKITNLLIPATDADASTKAYVDASKSTFRVRVGSAANIGLTGLYTLDGVVLVAGDRVAALGQSATELNGIWVAAAGAWARATDADQGSKLADGSLIIVGEGTLLAGTVWMLLTNNPITLNLTGLTFAQWPSNGSGLTWTNQTLAIGAGLVSDGHLGNRTADPALASPASTGTLTQLLGWITGRIKAQSGTTNWYDAPGTTLAAMVTHVADVANPHAVTKTQVGLSAVSNALQLVAASNLSDLASAVTARTNLGLGGAAILNVGTTAGTVAAGDSARFDILTGNVIWVDAVNGNDGTGVKGRLDKPFLTLGAAKTAATAGDTIYVLPGQYNERNLLKNFVNWYFLPGANVVYTGSDNGGIFDDGIYGSNVAVVSRITANGYFQNISGGIDTSILTLASALSVVNFTGTDAISDNGTALLLKSGFSRIRMTGQVQGELGVHVLGGTQLVKGNWILGGSSYGVYCQGGTSSIQFDSLNSTSADGVRFKDGTHQVTGRDITSAGGVGVRIEVPSGAQTATVRGARISSTFNSAAGTAVKLESSNLTLQSCVLVSNIAGTPATVSIDAASALNVKLYGHCMANLAKHANVTLLCGTLEVDTDVT